MSSQKALFGLKQASAILGISQSRIHTLIEKGILKDYRDVNPEKKKHYSLLSVTEVKDLKKSSNILRGGIITPKKDKKVIDTNSSPADMDLNEMVEKKRKAIEGALNFQSKPFQSFSGMATSLEVVSETLERIEQKVNTLLKIWS